MPLVVTQCITLTDLILNFIPPTTVFVISTITFLYYSVTIEAQRVTTLPMARYSDIFFQDACPKEKAPVRGLRSIYLISTL